MTFFLRAPRRRRVSPRARLRCVALGLAFAAGGAQAQSAMDGGDAASAAAVTVFPEAAPLSSDAGGGHPVALSSPGGAHVHSSPLAAADDMHAHSSSFAAADDMHAHPSLLAADDDTHAHPLPPAADDDTHVHPSPLAAADNTHAHPSLLDFADNTHAHPSPPVAADNTQTPPSPRLIDADAPPPPHPPDALSIEPSSPANDASQPALASAAPPQPRPAPLTLDAALQAAVDRSTAMQAAGASVRASADAAVRAGQLPDPMLKAGIDNLPVNGGERFTIGQESMTMRRIGIEQEWVSGEKRRLRSALAGEVVGRERAGYLAQLANVRQRTAAAWLDAAYAKQAVELQRQTLAQMTGELAATHAAYRGARASAADVALAEALLAQARDRLLTASQTFDAALIALSRWTAAPAADVAGAPPSPESAVARLAPDDLRRVQPALIAAAQDVAVADANTAVANSERNPNWTWEVAYQQRGGAYSNMVSIGVSIPLPIRRGSRQNRDAAEKAELGTRARLLYEDAQREIDADIRTEAAALANGRARIANLGAALLPAAQRRAELAVAAYRAGTGTLAEAFAARRAQLDAQLQMLDLERDVSQTWARLEYQVVPPALAAAQ